MTETHDQRQTTRVPALAAFGGLALMTGILLGAMGAYVRSVKALDEALRGSQSDAQNLPENPA